MRKYKKDKVNASKASKGRIRVFFPLLNNIRLPILALPPDLGSCPVPSPRPGAKLCDMIPLYVPCRSALISSLKPKFGRVCLSPLWNLQRAHRTQLLYYIHQLLCLSYAEACSFLHARIRYPKCRKYTSITTTTRRLWRIEIESLYVRGFVREGPTLDSLLQRENVIQRAYLHILFDRTAA